jgi:ubiquinol oxidase
MTPRSDTYHSEIESLVEKLNDPALLEEYKKPYDNYRSSFFPRLLGAFLVSAGNTVYGKKPSYMKFRAVEVIARVPYHSWESAAYTLLTMFYSNEQKALKLSHVSLFSRLAQDNETMHVVVISQLARKEERRNIITHTIIPLLFAFFYFWAAYILYLVKPKYALELNYLFEQHAFDQYSEFLATRGDELKKKPIESDFLSWYGRNPKSQYEFFQSVRNDEIIHRNRSIREIELNSKLL